MVSSSLVIYTYNWVIPEEGFESAFSISIVTSIYNKQIEFAKAPNLFDLDFTQMITINVT